MNRQGICEALEKVLPGVAKSNLIEELQGIRIRGTELRATNGSLVVRGKLDEDLGLDCVVPGQNLYKLLSSISEDEVVLTQTEGTVEAPPSLSVLTDRIRGVLNIVPIENFPSLDWGKPEWHPVPDGLLAGLEFCLYTVGVDVTLGPLCGVCAYGSTLYSSDRFRISKYQLGHPVTPDGQWTADTTTMVEGYQAELAVVIPSELIEEIVKHGDQVTKWAIQDNKILFSAYDGALIFGAPQLEGAFPPLEKYLQDIASFDKQVTLPTELRSALARQVIVLSRVKERNQVITLTLSADSILLDGRADSFGILHETVELAEKRRRDKVSFTIHPKFLEALLDVNVTLRYHDGHSLAMISSDGTKIHYVLTKWAQSRADTPSRTAREKSA